jgi:hypothetical protein
MIEKAKTPVAVVRVTARIIAVQRQITANKSIKEISLSAGFSIYPILRIIAQIVVLRIDWQDRIG